jgi:superfamily II DNA or RNA helicase
MIKLRPWQDEAVKKALNWLGDEGDRRIFLINAAPGAGKTIAACFIAKQLLDSGAIDRVVVIAPRREVVRQWAGDFRTVTGRAMLKITAAEEDVAELQLDVCATWSAVKGLSDAFADLCEHSNVLVICDEHHHAAVEAAWGTGADAAFSKARHGLILTGTPVRSDGEDTVWFAYDDNGRIDHPEEGTYSLSYGQAVDLEYCRPVTFHRHEGHFTVDLGDGSSVKVSSKEKTELPAEMKRIPALQRALEFYKLACSPLFEPDGKTPLASGYQGSMVEYACAKLDSLREQMPNAGGLVIAPSIEMAQYIAKLIEIIDGQKPIIVHTQTQNPDGKISAFRESDSRWIVSVAMISEGVDIKRLRVLIYLPKAMTELAFRQAIGRVVRTMGDEDDTRAYVVMPSFDLLENYARRVEAEMSPSARVEKLPSTKKCPVCLTEVSRGEKECPACKHEFASAPPRLRTCDACGAPNVITAHECQSCGTSFVQGFELSLDDALRSGAIVRGMDLDEEEVREGESIAADFRRSVVEEGDAALIALLRKVPEESYGRLKRLLNSSE